MNRVELEGVLAHELSHIKNYDILVSTLAVTMVGVVALLADFGLRFIWWGGGRRARRRPTTAAAPAAILAILGFAPADPGAARRRGSCRPRSAGGARRWPTSPASS